VTTDPESKTFEKSDPDPESLCIFGIRRGLPGL